MGGAGGGFWGVVWVDGVVCLLKGGGVCWGCRGVGERWGGTVWEVGFVFLQLFFCGWLYF